MSYSFLGGESRKKFSDQEDLFKVIEGFMGYLPNSHLSMAVNPQLNQSFAALAGTIFASQNIDQGSMQLIALASSLSSGCKYCQAHTSHGAHQAGVNEEKINDILRYQESSHYDDSEKAILDLAFASGKTPNQANQEHFDNLLKYFNNEQIIDELHFLKDIPVRIVQGRFDMICPPETAERVHRLLPNSKLVIVKDAGHAMSEPNISFELINATNEFRN